MTLEFHHMILFEKRWRNGHVLLKPLSLVSTDTYRYCQLLQKKLSHCIRSRHEFGLKEKFYPREGRN